jgi:hypothetical protein
VVNKAIKNRAGTTLSVCIENAKKVKTAAKACADTVKTELAEMDIEQKDYPIYLAAAKLNTIKKCKEQVNVGSKDSVSAAKKKCKDLFILMNTEITEAEATKRFKKVDQKANGKYAGELLDVADDETLGDAKIKEISDKLISIGTAV